MQQQSDQETKDRSDPHGSPDRSDDRSGGRSISITSVDSLADLAAQILCGAVIYSLYRIGAVAMTSQPVAD